MKINLDELNEKQVPEIINEFLNIPKNEVEVEFNGYFNLGENRVAKALIYLPKHVRSVIFNGNYVYTRVCESYQVPTGDSGPYSSGYKTEYRYYDLKNIGSFVKDYGSYLPKTVTCVSFRFSEKTREDYDTRTLVQRDLEYILYKLSKNVTQLKLIGLYHPNILSIIPTSIEVLDLEKVILSTPNTKALKTIEKRRLELRHLSVTGNDANHSSSIDFLRVFTHFDSLNYGFNQLNDFSKDRLNSLFSQLANLKLSSLLLEDNNLASLGCANLIEILPILSSTAHLKEKESPIAHIDLSNNGFLVLSPEDLKSVLEVLTSLKSLRLCESNTSTLSIDELIERFTYCLPTNISILCFNNCKLMGRSLEEFTILVSLLPDHIKVLDFSDNNFSKKELISIFSNMPLYIQKVKLNRNALCGLNKEELKEVFSYFPKNVELEVADNGFEGIPYTERNELLDALPDTLIDFGKTRLNVQGNGALTNYPQLLFKKIRHQNEFSSLQVFLLQLFISNKCDFKVFHFLLPYLLGTNSQETNRLVIIMERTRTYLLGKEASKATKKECQDAVKARVQVLSKDDTKLDLRRCFLGKLESDDLKALYNSISTNPRITSLGLRGNGFLKDEVSKRNFIASLSALPNTITHLDLSENGFEYLNEKELKELLVNGPRSLKFIVLANEKPINPKEQIARRNIPAHYVKITQNTQGMEMVEVLLKNYTKGNSRLMRIFTFHWGHNHIEEVNRQEALIKKGELKNVKDVLAEIEELNTNPSGGLGTSWMHLFNHTRSPAEQKNDFVPHENGIPLAKL